MRGLLEPSDRKTRWSWAAAALAVFAVALLAAFRGFWGADPVKFVPIPTSKLAAGEDPKRLSALVRADYRAMAWVVSRNSYALLHDPLHLFDAEPCYPAEKSLALTHPGITQGLLAAPAWVLVGDPIATFNSALFLKLLVDAMAMFLLVASWTRVPAAGMVAGVLYAFHASQIDRPFHLHVADNAWILFALFFAYRLLEHGRWRDVIGLGISCALQLGSSFYPLLAAALAAIPLAAWLAWHFRGKRWPVARLLVVLGIAALAAACIFSPYLAIRGEEFSARGRVFYASFSWFLPGGRLFPGWTGLVLVGCALALGRRRALAGIDGDPRAALLLAAGLVAVFAVGGNQPWLPNLHGGLAGVLPILDSVRLLERLALESRLLLCVVAGLGAAALLRTLPRRVAAPVAGLLVVLAFAETVRPPLPAVSSPAPFRALRLRPSEDLLAFYDALERAGNDGPMLELPVVLFNKGYRYLSASEQHLLTAYHHRESSGCYASFVPKASLRLAELSGRMPSPDALEDAATLGFTTIVVHEYAWVPSDLGDTLPEAAREPESRLVPILRIGERQAFALKSEREPSATPRPD